MTFMHTLGCDGCRGGWLVIERIEGAPPHGNTVDHSWRWQVISRFSDLFPPKNTTNTTPELDYAFIDIPIGLSDQASRNCDSAARRFLGSGFASSVFPSPTRSALAAASYGDANQNNRVASGKGLSKQAYFLLPKIRDIDEFLTQAPNWRGKLREAHPEVAFTAINGKTLAHKKKTSEGFNERLSILQQLDPTAEQISTEIIEQTRRQEVARDDVLDALCLCLMPLAGTLKTLPAQPERDATGLAMEICYFSP